MQPERRLMALSLADYLAERTTPETGAVILGLSAAAIGVATRLASFGNAAAQDAADAFAAPLARLDVRFLTSLPDANIAEIRLGGSLAVAIDPLGPPAAIETNTPPGTLFSIYPATGTAGASFLRPGTDQTAAGCILYGPRTTLALTTGHGTALFLLDRTAATFCLHTENLAIPTGIAEFAVNAADYRLWEPPVQRFIDDCMSGVEGPRGQHFDMRWTGSLAAEVHRILIRGGVYLAPQGTHTPHPLIHHCHPVAMLIEQAGGQATDGRTRLLGTTATALDAASPLVFGLSEKVDRVAAYHDMPDTDVSPLFGRRGLFRT
ncbi:MAG: fructose-bisphosphatase class I [Hyphomicrobiales bacterium]|nr:MAG: fructose-bisphosphatase class I [Hyphomicrobiales bacterium]